MRYLPKKLLQQNLEKRLNLIFLRVAFNSLLLYMGKNYNSIISHCPLGRYKIVKDNFFFFITMPQKS